MGQAVFIRGSGGVEVLEIGSYSAGAPRDYEILVAVQAAGLNRADCLQRRGFYPAPAGVVADVPGLEYAGVVSAVGSGVSRFAVGDRVMGIAAGGAMATELVTDERCALPVPTNLSIEDAAAIPEVFFTAYDALFLQGELRAGETVLVHSIGSGVGTAALQLAKRAGATVLGTSRTSEKLCCGQRMGLDVGFEVVEKTFADAVLGETDGAGANLIVDTVGAAYLEENIKCLSQRGRLVVVGLLGGVSGTLPLGVLLAKRARIIGTVLRSRSLEEKAALTLEIEQQVLDGFADRSLRPVVDCVLPMTEVARAHSRMEKNESFGKIVLRW